jgi:hypothetical protein
MKAMDFDSGRLRRGELIAGASGVSLLVFMFLFKWYGLGGAVPSDLVTAIGNRLHVATAQNAWHALTILRWLMLVTIFVALALALTQATRRSPAVPVSLSVIVTVLGSLTALLLVYRVLINLPGSDKFIDQKIGAFLGLVSALGIALGGFESLREEGVTARDAPTEIPTVVSGAR